MKTKIQIKSVFGKLLFEYEKENNTIKDTLIQANLYGANLREADLRGANLRGADLYGAALCAADLRGGEQSGAGLACAVGREGLLGVDVSLGCGVEVMGSLMIE